MGYPGRNDGSATYSAPIGFIYVFNMIVGTGALTLPKAFAEAGWLLSSIVLIFLVFISYMTATFMIEAMSIGNAIRMLNRNHVRENMSLPHTASDMDERIPLFINTESTETIGSRSIFEIKEQLEMDFLSKMVFNKVGVALVYLRICVYLFGDLTIYASVAPKSLRDVICTYKLPQNASFLHADANSGDVLPFSNTTIFPENDRCWETVDLSRTDVYRLCVAGFFLILGPFVFFNVSKTKDVQILTAFLRCLSFGIMIVLTLIRLSKGEGKGKPPQADLSGAPNLFGVCIYSLMCHHSLPALVTPIKQKSQLAAMFISSFVFILILYLLLSTTQIFAFGELEALCTSNFQPDHKDHITNVTFFQYFLALFPAFTLSTNFPIIAITLRNTLRHIFSPVLQRLPRFVDWYVLPIALLIPPLIISMLTSNLNMLVGIMGSFAGVAIQYLIPAFLVYYTRRAIQSDLPSNVLWDKRFEQIHRSIFQHWAWPVMVVIWSLFVYAIFSYSYLISF